MKETKNYIAVDLGASNGRVLLGKWDGERFELEELHRFENGPVNVLGHLYWDVFRLWSDIKTGLARYASRFSEPPAGVGVNTWGVDYALLDAKGNLLGNPFNYRDSRTDGMMDAVFEKVSKKEVFDRTGIQFMQLNTIFQLYSMVKENHPHLEYAETLLMMPDLFHYWLSGIKAVEYTDASTSQLFDARERRWSTEILSKLGIPEKIFSATVQPGTVLGELRPEVVFDAGLKGTAPVIAPAGHDTGSAVAAIPGLDVKSAYLSSGTWSLMGLEIPDPVINDQVREFNITNEGGVSGTIRFLKNIGGLWLVQESRRQWQRDGKDYNWEQLLRLAEKAEPFKNLVDPDAADFMCPSDMPAAIRAYCRSTNQPEPADEGAVIRCCLESLALRYRAVLEMLETLTGRDIETIRIVGGGSQNTLLNQFTSDACKLPVVTGPVEATALGNIMIQAIATGQIESLEAGRRAIAASVEQSHYTPGDAARWDDAYERFKKILSGV